MYRGGGIDFKMFVYRLDDGVEKEKHSANKTRTTRDFSRGQKDH